MSFNEKVKQMDMATILNFAEVGYNTMTYIKENKTDDLLKMMIKEVKQ